MTRGSVGGDWDSGGFAAEETSRWIEDERGHGLRAETEGVTEESGGQESKGVRERTKTRTGKT